MGGCVRQEQSLLGGPLSAGSTDGLDDLRSLFQPKQLHDCIFFLAFLPCLERKCLDILCPHFLCH